MRVELFLIVCFVLTTFVVAKPKVEVTPLTPDNFYLKVHEFGYHLIFFTAELQQESDQAQTAMTKLSLDPPTLDAEFFLHSIPCSEQETVKEIQVPKCPAVVLIRSKRERRDDGVIIIDRKHYHFQPTVDSDGVRSFLYEDILHFVYEDYKNQDPVLPLSVQQGLEKRKIEESLHQEQEQMDPKYYVRENSQIVKLNEHNFDSIVKDRKSDIMIEFFSPSCEPCQNIAQGWEDFAESAKKENKPLIVASVNCKSSPDLCNRFAIQHYPTVYLIHEKKIYDFGGQWNPEGWLAYAEGGYVNEEPEYIKDLQTLRDPETSKQRFRVKTDEEELELPENFVSQVEVVTGDNFKSLVLDSPKDVWFLEFYAPWCGYCKKLAPVWESLALRPDRNFRVGKVDATASDSKDLATSFGVRGYPTLKLIRDGTVYHYSGGRTIADFLNFISLGYKTVESTELKELLSAPKESKDEL